MKAKLQINSEVETDRFGLLLSKLVFKGFLLLLEGELGSGKTRLTKALGKGLKITQSIKSPTFNIMRTYDEGLFPLYHIDAYRLEGQKQDLGFEEYLDGDGVCVVEWYKFIESVLPPSFLSIKIEIVDENKRVFELESNGEKYDEIIKKVLSLWK